MSYIEDLEKCRYLPIKSKKLIAIGWLSNDYEFNKGDVSQGFYLKLKKICKSPWEPFASAGRHVCEICQFEGPSFQSNLYIPFHGKIYVSPTAIVHYIASHRYLPPEIFIEAVLACPEMKSMEYKKQLLLNGGKVLLQK